MSDQIETPPSACGFKYEEMDEVQQEAFLVEVKLLSDHGYVWTKQCNEFGTPLFRNKEAGADYPMWQALGRVEALRAGRGKPGAVPVHRRTAFCTCPFHVRHLEGRPPRGEAAV